MRKNNIIIIGSSGRLGTALCKKLLDKGENVIAVDINKEELEKQNNSFRRKTHYKVNNEGFF